MSRGRIVWCTFVNLLRIWRLLNIKNNYKSRKCKGMSQLELLLQNVRGTFLHSTDLWEENQDFNTSTEPVSRTVPELRLRTFPEGDDFRNVECCVIARIAWFIVCQVSFVGNFSASKIHTWEYIVILSICTSF